MNVFIWTHDAPRTLTIVQELLAGHSLLIALAAGYRDEDADGYTPLWPAQSDAFVVH